MDKNEVAASAKILHGWTGLVLLAFALPPYLTYAVAMQLSCRLQHGRWMDDDEADRWLADGSAKILHGWTGLVLLAFALPPYLTYAVAMQLSCRLQHGRWMDDDEADRWLADGWFRVRGGS